MQKLVDVLSPLQSLKRHQDVRSKRLDNTGGWLLRHNRFCLWRDSASKMGNNATLFCYGMPGAGKTILRYPPTQSLFEFTSPAYFYIGVPWINTVRSDIVHL